MRCKHSPCQDPEYAALAQPACLLVAVRLTRVPQLDGYTLQPSLQPHAVPVQRHSAGKHTACMHAARMLTVHGLLLKEVSVEVACQQCQSQLTHMHPFPVATLHLGSARSSLRCELGWVCRSVLRKPAPQGSAHYVLHALHVSDPHIAVHQRPLLLVHGVPHLLLAPWAVLQPCMPASASHPCSSESAIDVQHPRSRHVKHNCKAK